MPDFPLTATTEAATWEQMAPLPRGVSRNGELRWQRSSYSLPPAARWTCHASPPEKSIDFTPGTKASSRMAKKMGRPKSGAQTRDAEVTFALTPEDAAWFAEVSESLGFKSRSQFFTAVMERLRIGGLAPFAFLKVGYQIAKLAEANPSSERRSFWNPFTERIPPMNPADLPPPPLPEPVAAELEPADIKALRNAVRLQLT